MDVNSIKACKDNKIAVCKRVQVGHDKPACEPFVEGDSIYIPFTVSLDVQRVEFFYLEIPGEMIRTLVKGQS